MDIASLYKSGQAPVSAPAPIPADKVAENREIIRAVRALNAADLFGENRELSFLMDRESQRPVIRLVDRKTKDVIRQVPSEYVLRMVMDVARTQ